MINDDNHDWDVQEEDAPPEVEAFFQALRGRDWGYDSLGYKLIEMMSQVDEAVETGEAPQEARQMALVSAAIATAMSQGFSPPQDYGAALRVLRDAMRQEVSR